MWIRARASNQFGPAVIICGLWAGLTFTSTAWAQSADNSFDNSLILPGQPQRYNPLKHQSGSNRPASFHSSNRELDNESLIRSAEQLRNTEMSAEQRALNYQWLQMHEDGDGTQVGGRVLQTLMKMGFKTYWEGTRINLDGDEQAIPNSDGNGKVTEDIDYKIRMSGDKIKLSFEYEF